MLVYFIYLSKDHGSFSISDLNINIYIVIIDINYIFIIWTINYKLL